MCGVLCCILCVVCCMMWCLFTHHSISVFSCVARDWSGPRKPKFFQTIYAEHVHICLTSVDYIHFPFIHDEDNFIANPLKNSLSHAVFTYAAAIPTTSHQLPSNTRWRNIKSLLSWTSSIVELNLTTQDKLITLKFWDLNCKETILFLLILILHKYF